MSEMRKKHDIRCSCISCCVWNVLTSLRGYPTFSALPGRGTRVGRKQPSSARHWRSFPESCRYQHKFGEPSFSLVQVWSNPSSCSRTYIIVAQNKTKFRRTRPQHNLGITGPNSVDPASKLTKPAPNLLDPDLSQAERHTNLADPGLASNPKLVAVSLFRTRRYGNLHAATDREHPLKHAYKKRRAFTRGPMGGDLVWHPDCLAHRRRQRNTLGSNSAEVGMLGRFGPHATEIAGLRPKLAQN